jgi:hypothetical protein
VADPANPNEAFAAIARGDLEHGFALYERSLRGDTLPDAPAGLHIGMLEQAGRHDDAARLRDLAIKYSGDLATCAGSFLGAEPDEAAREYERLFERGFINSRMIHRYLLALSRTGRMEEHAKILAPDRLFELVDLDLSLAREVDRMLLDLEEQAEQQEAAQSVRNMRFVGGLSRLDHPAAKALIAEIHVHTKDYLERWHASDHPFAPFVSSHMEIKAWGLISRGEGYNIPHIHGEGWATGVFYPRSVESEGGDLVIGPPKKSGSAPEDWGYREVKPRAGLLVLMPSFYTHWTLPLERPGLRTSVAFDVPRVA